MSYTTFAAQLPHLSEYAGSPAVQLYATATHEKHYINIVWRTLLVCKYTITYTPAVTNVAALINAILILQYQQLIADTGVGPSIAGNPAEVALGAPSQASPYCWWSHHAGQEPC
jgi:hypothetical protein